MTYPPQPGPHGQYGQPHPGGYPPPQPPGPPPEPPRQNGRTGLIVGVTVALVLLAAAAVAITGFWAPGYFLADETTSSEHVDTAAGQQAQADTEQQPPKPSLQTQASEPASEQGGSAEDVAIVRGLAEDAVTAINTRDADLARRISCQRDSDVDFSKLPKDTRVRMLGDPVVEGDAASVPFEITVNGETHREPLTANRENGSWCLG